jgi:hypothetical protein
LRKEEPKDGKKSFGRKMKDKLTGSTHEERVKQREIQKQIVSPFPRERELECGMRTNDRFDM